MDSDDFFLIFILGFLITGGKFLGSFCKIRLLAYSCWVCATLVISLIPARYEILDGCVLLFKIFWAFLGRKN